MASGKEIKTFNVVSGTETDAFNVTSSSDVSAISYDVTQNVVYWSEQSSSDIYGVYSNGTGEENFHLKVH